MDILIDTSALLAVIVAEPEREQIVERTTGNSLIAPASVPWEIGNAFSAMIKQNRVEVSEAKRGMEIFQAIPLRYVSVQFENALAIAAETKTYAYDAYFLDCALRYTAPLLTLDRALERVARKLGITIVEL